MNKNDVTHKYEEEKLRVQEQSQLIYLQNQIDELRRMLKDQNNKYAWAMEQARRAEGQVAQIQNVIERQAQEIQATLEVYKRELGNIRRDIAAVQLRAEEAIKPVREMQAGIHQLSEARRQDRESVTPWFARIEELEHAIREVVAHVRELDERQRQVQPQFEQLRSADTAVVEEIRHVNEQVEVEKQVLRRQAVEAQQMIADVRTAMDEPVARVGRLEERARALQEFVKDLPEAIAAVDEHLPGLHDEMRRIELMATERFLLTQERIEDLRHQNEGRLTELHDTDDHHLRHLTNWLERIDAWCREEEGRVTRISNRIELLHQRHDGRLTDLESQELQLLERITGAWQTAFENVKQIQVERRESFGPEEGTRQS
ncbi:MAG: hypothetical protein H0X37_22925 [Herpetosiphonaceae bacterium]|nr:hypothetical protein [Herpetosiphonaceae bacterium]